MASGNTMFELLPRDFYAENAGNPQAGEYGLSGVGLLKGIGFHPGNTAGAVATSRLPSTAGLATGLTFKLIVAEDTTDSPATGGNCVFGVNVFPLANGSNYYVADTTNLGTETTVTQAMPTSSNLGKTMEISAAIANANLPNAGLAANVWVGVRVRRLGANASDTCKSRILLLGVTVTDT